MIENNDENKQISLFDKTKLLHIPILIIVGIITIVGLIGMNDTREIMEAQMEMEGVNFAKQAAANLTKYMDAEFIIIENLEEKVTIAGNIILENKAKVDNDSLKKIADRFGISKIYYYTPEGTVRYSATGEYIGWKADVGDYIYNFMKSDKKVFHEGMRKGTENDNYFKFSYFKDSEGNFVQLGYFAQEVVSKTDKQNLKSAVNDIADNKNTAYARVIDSNLISIADTEETNIGTDFSKNQEYKKVISGGYSVNEVYYQKMDAKVLAVAVPIIYNDRISGILEVGLSMKTMDLIIKFALFRILIASLLTALLIVWVQTKFLIRPLIKLNDDIQKINIESDSFDFLNINKKNSFYGMYVVINNLLKKNHKHRIKEDQFKEELKYLAYHDDLTGLKNRRSMLRRMEKLVDEDMAGAVILLATKNLQEINDIYGHNYGDEILISLARRIQAFEGENAEVFRFGGDEFIVLASGDTQAVEDLCSRIFDGINKGYKIDDYDFEISSYAGVSFFPKDGTSATELISKADVAMHQIKNKRNQGYAFFEQRLLDELNEKNQIFNHLKQAIETQKLSLLYQPIVSTESGEIDRFEALLRLSDHNISPDKFIGIAEDKGLIIEMGRWVVQEVVRRLAYWNEKSIQIKPISINFSPRQLNDHSFIEYLEGLLIEYNIEAKFIEIEITENIFVDSKDETTAFIEKLRNIGVKISLDDFGSGYSSLTYLTYLPIDKIKLDKTINDKYLNIEDYKIIKHIINMAHELKLQVVAEGIETQGQYEILKSVECDFVQGYLFSKPVDAITAENILENGLNNSKAACKVLNNDSND